MIISQLMLTHTSEQGKILSSCAIQTVQDRPMNGLNMQHRINTVSQFFLETNMPLLIIKIKLFPFFIDFKF